MSRAQELEGRLQLSEILDGAAVGDRLYAARRFKPQDAAAAMKMTRLLRKAIVLGSQGQCVFWSGGKGATRTFAS